MKNCQQNQKEVPQSTNNQERTSFSFLLNLVGANPKNPSHGTNFDEQSENNQDFSQTFNEIFFEAWGEDNDPAMGYFASIQSCTDYNLLMQFMRKKKVFGIMFLMFLINLANLLIPEQEQKFYQISKIEDESSHQTSYVLSEQIDAKAQMFEKLKYGVNFLMAAFLFCLTFYIVFCSNSQFLSQSNGKYEIIVAIIAQYIMAFCFVLFPNTFFFQFTVNMTIIFTMLVKEAIRSKRQSMILLGNTCFVNYIAFESLKYYQRDQKNANNTTMAVIGFDEMSRTYMVSILTLMFVMVLIQKQNQSLIKMLVNKIQTLQHSLDIKDTYNASMIHELRNPLNAVLGAIGLLKYSRSLSKEDQETLNIASVSGEILITLINNALDGAKIEANRLELDPHKSDIVETLTKAASLFQWKAKEKKIGISLKIGKKIPDLVEIDEARITQVLVNIIGNAVKFTPENGKIKVRARFTTEEQSGISNSQIQNYKAVKFNSMGSYIEDEEYEQKFFDNKELFLDMGEASEGQYEEEKIMDRNIQTAGTLTPNDYEVESNNDKSMEPQLNLNNNPPVMVNMKNMKSDSFTSLCNNDSMEERKNHSKSYIGDRELDFKNSFHEWKNPTISQTQQALETLQINSPKYSQLINQNMNKNYLNQNQSEQNNIEYLNGSQDSNRRNSNLQPRVSQALSESLNRDISLSYESNYDKHNFRTYTNSSCSNQIYQKKKNPTKSKFHNQVESDQLQDHSDGENENHSNPLLISENGFFQTHQQIVDLHNRGEDRIAYECKGILIIEVIDNGIGISQEGITKLFQPFQQADKSIQAKYGGTGLGLWITNKLIGLMRGSIEVSSELNKGTTFTMKIPVNGEYKEHNSDQSEKHIDQNSNNSFSEKSSPRMRKVQNKKAKNSSYNQKWLRSDTQEDLNILLFQKDEIMTKLFKKYLQKQKIEFKFSTNFKDMLRSFRFQQYNACFIDIDINVTAEDLDKLVIYIQTLKSDDRNYLCKIFCLYSRDIEKSKTKILQKNNIKCLKKPIQGYQISKILKKIQTSNFQPGMKKPVPLDNNNFLEDLGNRLPTFNQIQFINQAAKSYPDQKDNEKIKPSQYKMLDISSSSEQRILDESPPSYYNQRFLTTQKHQRNQQEHSTANFKQSLINQEDEKDMIQSQIQGHYYKRKTSNQATHPFPTNSSSRSSSVYNFNQQAQSNQTPKLNKQIQKIKQDEMFNGGASMSDRDSPRNHTVQRGSKGQQLSFSNEFKQVQKRKTDDAMETLLTKNAKNDHYTTNSRDSFRQKQMPLLSDEEEKKSNQYQVNTPNFNNLSQQSHSGLLNSGTNSIKKMDNDMHSSRESFVKQQNSEYGKYCNTLPGGAVAAPQIEQIKTVRRQSSFKKMTIGKKGSSSSPKNVQIDNNSDLPRPTILVVDDNEMNRFIITKMLEKVPYIIQNNIQLIVVEDGQQAFQKFENQQEGHKIKLILMDCEMPVLNGYDASKKIRDYENNNNSSIGGDSPHVNEDRTLIIGLSGNQGELHVRKCKQAGMNDTITKPIVFEQLKQIVKNALDPSAQMSRHLTINSSQRQTHLSSGNNVAGYNSNSTRYNGISVSESKVDSPSFNSKLSIYNDKSKYKSHQ